MRRSGDAARAGAFVIEKLGAWLTARQPEQAPPAPLLSALSKPARARWSA